eukprot:CAMPEP_0175887598 /NCGR_PEP_ID=MMETSP0107_2-20121207/46255_1 /TAXON_ID=195067 ORGANISM="Goniomonas pacifica, Strain CCMP1869" /NCGR_SAMPLE_ID=MMETSP0107_2 /ASSEMBLY_ACC=CAM_ASM_000203 /LENGTH=486 /DNA_ID=CAMNT_0017208057 /DNA_START=30 /DNA_END=1491 /DNA_ORIENTATION=-
MEFYQSVMTQFAARFFTPGTPLSFLYLMFAGQFNALLTPDQLPGLLSRWKQNLSLMMSFKTQESAVYMQSLGDALWSHGMLVGAAHLCYLCAENPIDDYNDGARLVLVGARGSPAPALLGWRVLHAAWLVEMGLMDEALAYVDGLTVLARRGAPFPPTAFAELQALESQLGAVDTGAPAKGKAVVRGIKKLVQSGPKSAFDKTLTWLMSDGSGSGPVDDGRAAAAAAASMMLGGQQPDHSATSQQPQQPQQMQQQPPQKSQKEIDAEQEAELQRQEDEKRRAAEAKKKEEDKKKKEKAEAENKKNQDGGGGWRSWIPLTNKKKKEMDLGESNEMYYDEAAGKWRTRGQEDEEEEELKAPPTMSEFMQSAAPVGASPVPVVPTNTPMPGNDTPQDRPAMGISGPPAPKTFSALAGGRGASGWGGDEHCVAAAANARAIHSSPAYTIFRPTGGGGGGEAAQQPQQPQPGQEQTQQHPSQQQQAPWQGR